MNRTQSILRRGLLRLAPVAGLLSVLLAGEPMFGANAQEQVTKDFQKSVTLGAGQSVRVEHKFGEVRVHGESGREVKISATIRVQANSRDEAQSFADKIQIEVQQTTGGVEVKTVYPDEHAWHIRIGKSPS